MMMMMKDYDDLVKFNYYPNWPYIPNHPYKHPLVAQD